jgi:hypothetical protein
VEYVLMYGRTAENRSRQAAPTRDQSQRLWWGVAGMDGWMEGEE